ncbi:MAG: MFS transporter [Nitratireductor sp.]
MVTDNSRIVARILGGFSPLTIALGITMTVAYGSLFYSFPILAPAIMAEFGWSRTFVFGAFSSALVAGAFFAPFSGRLLDRRGGRFVLSLGTVLSSAALVAMAWVNGPTGFMVALFAIEATATFVQYEAGFATLAQLKGEGARPQISAITLIAGFASTLFWPLCGWLLAHMDWRQVYLVLGLVNLAICLPLHIALPGRGRTQHEKNLSETSMQVRPRLAARERRNVLLALAIAFSAGGFVIAAVQAHFPRLFVEAGYSVAAAAAFGAMIGPFQVGSRIIELLYGQRHHPVIVGLVANAALVAGVALLLAIGFGAPAAIAFAALFGTGQGLAHIIRGAIPLALFGPDGYGQLTGNLGFFRILVTASAPVAIAAISDANGNRMAIIAIIAMAAVAFLALLPLRRYARS